jgi:hypothetical protein
MIIKFSSVSRREAYGPANHLLGSRQKGEKTMSFSKRGFFSIMLLALLGGAGSGLASNEPVNQCVIIPEIVSGPSASGNYQPESCVTLRIDNNTYYAANSGPNDPGIRED